MPEELSAITEAVQSIVRGYLTGATGEVQSGLNPDQPFMEAGLDSLDMLKARPITQKTLRNLQS